MRWDVKVGLGIPFWGNNLDRVRNHSYVKKHMTRLYPWDVILELPAAATWNRGKARNTLVQRALDFDVDVLVLCDSDTFIGKGALDEAIEMAAFGDMVFAFDEYRGLTDAGTEFFLKTGGYQHTSYHIHHAYKGSFGGVFAFRPELWKLIGGSPEMEGWGFEDIITVVNYRTLSGFETKWIPGILTHLYHDRDWAPFDIDYTRNIAVCRAFEAEQYNPDGVRRLRKEYSHLFRW